MLDHKPLRGRASLLVSVRRQSRLAENLVHRSPGLTYSQAARHKGVKANVSPSKDPTNQLSKGRMLLCDHPPVVVNFFCPYQRAVNHANIATISSSHPLRSEQLPNESDNLNALWTAEHIEQRRAS